MDLRGLMNSIQSALQNEWSTVFAIIVVVIAMIVALRLVGMAVHTIARGLLQREREPGRELAQKAKTLSHVVETTGRVLILTIALLTILSLLGQDIAPLLASAGIAGIAIRPAVSWRTGSKARSFSARNSP